MEVILESLSAEWRALLNVLPRIGVALIVIILSVLVGRLIGRGAEQVIKRSDLPNTHASFFRQVVMWLFVFIGLLVALNVVGLRGVAAGLLTGGGVTAVVLGFAFREIGENFLAGFFLAFSRPFKVNDVIESGGLRGVVQSIELRYTHVRTADGRDIFIPSSQLFKDPLINFTRDGLRRYSFTVGIDYGDDPVQATTFLREAVDGVPGVMDSPPPGIIIAGLNDSWVTLEVFYWINTFDVDNTAGKVQSGAMAVVREALRERGYTISCDTVTNLALGSHAPLDLIVAKPATDAA